MRGLKLMVELVKVSIQRSASLANHDISPPAVQTIMLCRYAGVQVSVTRVEEHGMQSDVQLFSLEQTSL